MKVVLPVPARVRVKSFRLTIAVLALVVVVLVAARAGIVEDTANWRAVPALRLTFWPEAAPFGRLLPWPKPALNGLALFRTTVPPLTTVLPR